MIPFYLSGHLTDIKEKKEKTTGLLISSTGNTDLEIYYYGELIQIGKTPYIGEGEYPCLIVAKDPKTDERFVVFDGAKHGYDAMFCNAPVGDEKRTLKAYDFAKGKMAVTFGYAIDYEEERDDYTFNDKNEVELTDGTYLDWNKAKSIGFDWFSMRAVDKKKVFVDLELA
ncbi:MAG: hypothetical protein K2M95_06715 [Clostridiales bacterium]|nr:hypothetical protein [Clostridiales bacterium]